MLKNNKNPRVKTVKPQKNYHLHLEFTNGEWRVFDVSPYLEKGIFRELKLLEIFFSVKVLDGTVQWQNIIVRNIINYKISPIGLTH